MNLQGIVFATCLTGLAMTAAVVWVIDDHYQRALRRELEETTGQVGGLRVQAEALKVEQAERRRELDALRAEIVGAEAALAAAQAQAEDSRCKATHARVDAVVTLVLSPVSLRCYRAAPVDTQGWAVGSHVALMPQRRKRLNSAVFSCDAKALAMASD